MTPPQVYLTLSLRALGFSTTNPNLLSIPSVVIGGVTAVLIAYLSERINSRILSCVLLQFWALPLLVGSRRWSFIPRLNASPLVHFIYFQQDNIPMDVLCSSHSHCRVPVYPPNPSRLGIADQWRSANAYRLCRPVQHFCPAGVSEGFCSLLRGTHSL